MDRTIASGWSRRDGAVEARARSLEPYVLPLIVATGLLSRLFHPPGSPLMPWLLGLTFALFLLVLDRPAWALVPILVTELTTASYYLTSFGMSQRFAVTVLATLLTLGTLLRYGDFGDKHLRRVLLPSLALVTLATILNAMYSPSSYVVQYLRYQAVQVLALILAAVLIRSRRDLKRIALITLGVAVLTGFAAVMQHVDKSGALYGLGSAAVLHAWKGRSLGLSNSPVIMTNQMVFALPVVLGVLFAGPWRLDRTRFLLVLSAVILAGGLYVGYARSSLFAIAPALAMIGIYLRGRRRQIALGAVIIGIVLFEGLQGTGFIGSRYYKDAKNDHSAATHQALLNVGLAVALDRGFVGIGHKNFEAISQDYVDAVSPSNTSGASSIGKEQPHNDFLSVWISWGILALLAYLAIFLGALRNLWIAARHDDDLIRGLAVGCAGGLAAYAANSFFHNLMDSSTFLWLYAGLSVALVRLASMRRPAPQVARPRFLSERR